MLGEALSMLVPQVVGFRMTGALPEGATATDLVLTVTETLRKTGVVGKFVEYFGPGLAALSLADRATLGNMSPEYGATCGFFPVDDATLQYLRLTGRPDERVALVEAYCKENMLWHEADDHPTYSQVVELDLGTVEPSLAGPRRPQDRVPLRSAKDAFLHELPGFGVDYGNSKDEAVAESFPASDPPAHVEPGHEDPVGSPVPAVAVVDPEPAAARVAMGDLEFELHHGCVVIAAITSCTNTSNPQVMVAAGLLAKKAVERGLDRKPWVKSSLAPGSRVVTDYYEKAGLTPVPRGARLPHRRLRLHDLHRELRPAAGRDLRGGDRERPRRLRRPLRQPELRGAHPSRGEGQLPRLAAARRRVRARRPDGPRPDDRADRPGPRRQRRLPARALADLGGDRRDRSPARSPASSSAAATRTSSPATRPGARSTRPPAISTPGTRARPTSAGRPTSRGWRSSRRASRTSPAHAASCSSATRSRPTTSPRPARSSRTARPGTTSSSTASSAASSTRTAPAAATTR